jgi:uncharacterized protein YhbP (UPF0306 family)
VWAAAVFYANDDWQLRTFSPPSQTRHARNMAAIAARWRPRFRRITPTGRTIKGIQLEGTVEQLDGARRSAALALYSARFNFLAQPVAAIESALARVNWYELRPRRLYFVDNAQGFGHRDEIGL